MKKEFKAGRDTSIELLYKAGHTLQEIGDTFHVSREYIRQILRRLGVSRELGGSAIRGLKRLDSIRRDKFSREEKKERRCRSIYGCSRAELAALGPVEIKGTPAERFYRQRRNALRRGVGWQITLPEWWKIWSESGVWKERGVGGYVMARYGDSGPYSVGNVRIITSSENAKEARQMDKILGRKFGFDIARDALFLSEVCGKGHPMSGENLYINPKTLGRLCKTCNTLWKKKHRQQLNDAKKARYALRKKRKPSG